MFAAQGNFYDVQKCFIFQHRYLNRISVPSGNPDTFGFRPKAPDSELFSAEDQELVCQSKDGILEQQKLHTKPFSFSVWNNKVARLWKKTNKQKRLGGSEISEDEPKSLIFRMSEKFLCKLTGPGEKKKTPSSTTPCSTHKESVCWLHIRAV